MAPALYNERRLKEKPLLLLVAQNENQSDTNLVQESNVSIISNMQNQNTTLNATVTSEFSVLRNITNTSSLVSTQMPAANVSTQFSAADCSSDIVSTQLSVADCSNDMVSTQFSAANFTSDMIEQDLSDVSNFFITFFYFVFSLQYFIK